MAVGVGTGVLLVLTVRLLARERWSRFVYRSCWFSFWSWGNYCFLFLFISGLGLFAGWLDGAACFGSGAGALTRRFVSLTGCGKAAGRLDGAADFVS